MRACVALVYTFRVGPFDTLLQSSLVPAGKSDPELAGKSLPELWQTKLQERMSSKRVQAIFPHFKYDGEPVHDELEIPVLRRVQKNLRELVYHVLPAAGSKSWWHDHEPNFCTVHGDLNAANIMVDLHGNPWYIDFAVCITS